MGRQNVSTGGPWEGKIGYSRAVRVGASISRFRLDGHDSLWPGWQGGSPYDPLRPATIGSRAAECFRGRCL